MTSVRLKKSLLEIGGIELGQVYHKCLDYKPSLWLIRNQEEMLKKHWCLVLRFAVREYYTRRGVGDQSPSASRCVHNILGK